jgi:hypothetical protein
MTKEELILKAKDIINNSEYKDIMGLMLKKSANTNLDELYQYLKFVAEQAWDPGTEKATIRTYGNELVNISKQLHPEPDWIKNRPLMEQKIKGGKADKKSLKDIADKFDVNLSELKKELAIGIKVEMEHTKNKSTAEDIAMDHLSEIPDYYTRLSKMENKAQRDWRLNEDGKQLIKRLIREELKVKNNKVSIVPPFDNIKKTTINGRVVYAIFGNLDYYGNDNREAILAMKNISQKLTLDTKTYQKFLIEFKKRFNSIPDLNNTDKVVSLETTASLTKEMGQILNRSFIENGFSKINKELKVRSIKPEDRHKLDKLFDLNFDIDNHAKICVLDDFITTGTSFKNAFNLIPTDIDAVGVCLFILNV